MTHTKHDLESFFRPVFSLLKCIPPMNPASHTKSHANSSHNLGVAHQLLHHAAQLPRAAPVLRSLPAPESHEIQSTQTSAKISDLPIPPGSDHTITVLCIYIYVYMSMYIYIYVHIYICICIHMYMYIYICICIYM